MKPSILIFCVLAVFFTQFETNAGPLDLIFKKYVFDPAYPLYLSDGEKFTYDQVDQALDKVFSYNKPVVFFVHGRGNEPHKSLVSGSFVEGGAVRKLETQYNTRVLMFNWNSKAFMYDRSAPLSRMPESALSLKRVLDKVKIYLDRPQNQNKKMTMLAHSMGSIVLETMVKAYHWPSSNLFKQIFFTSPDADNINHWQWLNEIADNEKTYVSINVDDDILEKSTDSREAGRMALGLRPVLPYAGNATYLDLSKLGKKPNQATGVHEVFNKANMKGQVVYCKLFSKIITGEQPEIENMTDITDQSNYYKIKFQRDEGDICLRLPEET